MHLLLHLIQAMAVFVVIAYAYCKSPWFRPVVFGSLGARDKIVLYLFFSLLSILGTYLGMPVQDAIANTRAIGPVLAGLIGGPLLGTAVGFTGGLHRYFLGGFTALSCSVSTTVEGTIGGLVCLYLYRKGRQEKRLDPKVGFLTTFFAELVQMAIILLVSRPFGDALSLVQTIAVPMILSSSMGAALFLNMVQDQRNIFDRVAATTSARALKIAERTVNILRRGFNRESAADLAQVIHEEAAVGAVAITDTEKVLAFVGYGSDHHLPGEPIASALTREAIEENRVVFVDGVRASYACPLSKDCPLHSVLVVPLEVDGRVIGTIKLYERSSQRFLNMNRALGEGIASLLSNQLLQSQYEMQKSLLVRSELKLLQAQVNPHFLFNALNTIVSILRNDAGRAKDLLIHLSNLFRKNLNRSEDLSTLEEELEHVHSYLEIEKARLAGRLQVDMEIDPTLLGLRMPTFTLQPLIENAIKHGISNMLEPGRAVIRARRDNGIALIEIEDNAGSFVEKEVRDGHGIRIVDKRLKILFGAAYGTTVACRPGEQTKVTVRIPVGGG